MVLISPNGLLPRPAVRRLRLAIDGVADTRHREPLGCLAPKGVLVFYSGISGKPFVAPRPALHLPRHRNPRISGSSTGSTRQRPKDHRNVRPPRAAGRVRLDRRAGRRHFPFAQIAEAVAVAQKKRGKALLMPG